MRGDGVFVCLCACLLVHRCVGPFEERFDWMTNNKIITDTHKKKMVLLYALSKSNFNTTKDQLKNSSG